MPKSRSAVDAEPCPGCKSPMAIAGVIPAAMLLPELTVYRCASCGYRRTVESGLPEFSGNQKQMGASSTTLH